eukprot:NODE_184_length_13742_cov_0.550539.p3 type:complete len:381 gc:universal NODE_184_length_13742_cov_0.550539:3874-5016(+)
MSQSIIPQQIQIGDVVSFLSKNKYNNTLDILKTESGNAVMTDSLHLKYLKLKDDYRRLLGVTRHLADCINELDDKPLEISNLVNILTSMDVSSNSSTRKNSGFLDNKPDKISTSGMKRNAPPVDSAKMISPMQRQESIIPSPDKLQLKTVMEYCKAPKLDDQSVTKVVDYLSETHSWSITDMKMVLAIGRYGLARSKLEPVLILDSMAKLISSKPYVKTMALKSLSYLSLDNRFAQDIALRQMLDKKSFLFYTQENEDVSGLAYLLLNLSERTSYLIDFPELAINYLMDIFEFGSERTRAVGLVIVHNIAFDNTTRFLLSKIQIDDVFTRIASPKLNTAIDFVRLKLTDPNAKFHEILDKDDTFDLDPNLVEDLELFIAQ